MRCSSSEPLLDPYVDGGLSAPDRARLERHLDGCAGCTELLAEIRVIDGLLVTRSLPELPANFTFKIMAEARSLAAPESRRHPVRRILLAYLAVAWLAIGAFVVLGGAGARATIVALSGTLGLGWSVVAAVAAGVSTLLGHNGAGIGATMGAVLVLDLLTTLAAVASYGVYRRRLVRIQVAADRGES